ncbi:polynucleotide 5'-hydroxyl-kinase NOL9 [Uranotaenia lowii]|uniref:polynucleotide 5'-hydroxyl-kinase NOL9 n=1 Tax=Uranotaenia lowii TaxID=190385 RepID=UPI002479B861|nr:polynucleotide 5'-hydroxyl-kinase NOL9 [Uranotaenia lowii]
MNRGRQEFAFRGKSFNGTNKNQRKNSKSRGSKSWNKNTQDKLNQEPEADEPGKPEKVKITNGFKDGRNRKEHDVSGIKGTKPNINVYHKTEKLNKVEQKNLLFNGTKPKQKFKNTTQKASEQFRQSKVLQREPPKNNKNMKPAAKKNIENNKQDRSSIDNKKRKMSESTSGTGKKPKTSSKTSSAPSESDSDADDYIDKFFQDVSNGEDEIESTFRSDSCGEDSIDDDDDESQSDSSVQDPDDEDDAGQDGEMSFDELVTFFGSYRDKKEALPSAKDKKSNKKQKNDSKTRKAKINSNTSVASSNDWIEEDNKPPEDNPKCSRRNGQSSKVKHKIDSSAASSSSWVEEENDIALEYKDSESDAEQSPQKEAAAVKDVALFNKNMQEHSEDDSEYNPEEDSDEDDGIEYGSDDDDMLSFEMDSEEGSSENSYDDHEFSSDFDSDDEYLSEEEEDDDEYGDYWEDSYDSDEDDDYVQPDDDDLLIVRGAARIYEIDDNDVSFNSDIDSAQIVELPSSDQERRPSVATTSGTDGQTETEDDKDSCPELVPIYDVDGELIDSEEKLTRIVQKKDGSLKLNSAYKKSKVSEETKSCSDSVFEEPRSSGKPSSSDNTDTMKRKNRDKVERAEPMCAESETTESPLKKDCHFYNSIDLRISLMVLRKPLYMSGYLTIQPLIGELEVMGYRLRRGECRQVFAARGYQSLNLTPRFEERSEREDCRKQLESVIGRVGKHFADCDLRELVQQFDSKNSVLILLQADCNNRKITVVERYMPEDHLFPRVEYMKRSSFYTTEYLLNVEFITDEAGKSTAPFQSDAEWDKIGMDKNSKIIVTGGKGAGKSTLCQYLINKHISKHKKILLIDLDIGQPIQHIPETMSATLLNKPLLGVTSFDPIKPLKCLLFGSLDVVSSPIFYIQNVRQMVQYCNQHHKDVPWVINTMGYVTGFGEELMAAIFKLFSPTDAIQLVCSNKTLPIPNFKNPLTPSFINQYQFQILESELPRQKASVSFRHYQLEVCFNRRGFALNAPKRRNVALLSNLANILNDSSSEWFNEVRPFCAPISKLQILITREDTKLADEQLPAVLNATLVYLCRKVDGGLYECLGIGIVRGVDKNNNVYLLQSLSSEELSQVTVLAICSSSLPNAIFLRQSARIQGNIPYVYNVV